MAKRVVERIFQEDARPTRDGPGRPRIVHVMRKNDMVFSIR